MNAPFKLRLHAFLFDYLLILAYLTLLIIVNTILFPSLQTLFAGSLITAQLTGFLMVTLPVSLYFIISDSRLVGQSFGKKKVGIQVINKYGQQLSIRHSIIRVALKFLPWEMAHFLVYRLANLGEESIPLYLIMISTLTYGLIFAYLLTAIFTKRKQALYDMVCGTRVLEVIRKGYGRTIGK